MPSFPPVVTQHPVTHLDFFAGRASHSPGRQEFINGVVFPLPSVTRNHQIIVDNIARVLEPQIRYSPCELVRDQVIGNGRLPPEGTPPGRFSHAIEGVFTYPDFVIMLDPRELFVPSAHVICNPCVLIEVLTPDEESYAAGSRFTALREWLDHRFTTYVLVASDRPEVAHYRRQSTRDWALEVLTDFADVVSLARVGCSVMVGEIYTHVRDKAGRPLVMPED